MKLAKQKQEVESFFRIALVCLIRRAQTRLMENSHVNEVVRVNVIITLCF